MQTAASQLEGKIRRMEEGEMAEQLDVVALWEASNKRFDLDTLRVPNRSPTPISKSNDVLGQSEDIWGGPGPPFPADFGSSSGPGRLKKHIFVSPLKRPLREG